MAEAEQPGTRVDDATKMSVQFQKLTAFHELSGAAELGQDAEAALLGTDVGVLRGLRAAMRGVVDSGVAQLMNSPEVRAAVERLPKDFSVAFVGDSLTADHQSWAEMARGVLAATRPDVQVMNLGKSGDTTADLIRRLTLALGDNTPSLFVVLIGSNDACRTVPFPGKTFVSDDETRANLQKLAEIINYRDGRLVWVTPPPLLEDKVAVFPVFTRMGIRYTIDDLSGKAQIVRERPERVIDLWDTFGEGKLMDLLLADGLHLGPSGHAAVARRVILEGLG